MQDKLDAIPEAARVEAERQLVGDERRADRRRHRPRGAVELHHLRRVRRAVPGGHRARRPHHRHAPLPGADRVGVPVRAGRPVQEPGEQGQPLGPERQGPHQVDRRDGLRDPGVRPGRGVLRRLRVPVLGRLRRRLRGPREEDHQGRRRTARHRGRRTSWCSAQGETCTGDSARRAGNEFLFQMLAQQNIETARRGVRDGADSRSARSSSPAPTASTRWATSTRRSAASTRSCTTPSC